MRNRLLRQALLLSLIFVGGGQSNCEPRASSRLVAADYGDCKWDATHDVANCIEGAIADAASRNADVEIPRGTWQIGHSIELTSNLTIRGGNGETVLRPTPDNNSNPIIFKALGTSNISVANLTLDGGGSDFLNKNPLAVITNTQNVIFSHLTLQNARGIGLLFQGGIRNSGVRDSFISNIGNHWRTTRNPKDRAQGVVFCCGEENLQNFCERNSFSAIGLDALQFSNQVSFSAAGNKFELDDNQHSQLSAPDFPAGIFEMYSSGSSIDGNRIRGAQGCGIDASGFRNSKIVNNQISESGACGIGFFLGYDHKTQTESVLLENNTIFDNVRWKNSPFKGGITIGGGTPSKVVIERNTITNINARKSQTFAISVLRGTRPTDLRIEADNKLEGSGMSPVDRQDLQTTQ